MAAVLALATVSLACSDGQACDAVARFPVLVVRIPDSFSASTGTMEGCLEFRLRTTSNTTAVRSSV
jgi:hypothetical protein